MSEKFLENKQMIHIAAEAVVLLGLTFYFSSKNKKLQRYIEELAQRVEEQEDKIQKMETTFSNQMTTIAQTFQQQNMQLSRMADQLNLGQAPLPKFSKPTAKVVVMKDSVKKNVKPVTPKNNSVRPSTNTFVQPSATFTQPSAALAQPTSIPEETEEDADEVEENDSELDEELGQELSELDDLKKNP